MGNGNPSPAIDILERQVHMDFAEVRRVAITALFSDDLLIDRLVLKGGNALSIVYGITQRTSLDLDFSMAGDFEDFDDARDRLFRALRDRFDAKGLVVFGERFEPKPRLNQADEKPWWGGYELRLKLIERAKYESLKHRPDKLSINALVTGTAQERTFSVDLSKGEYVAGKAERELDYFTIFVYTPEMIVIEKPRAICQQMPEYGHKGRPAPRARDFFDIHSVLQACAFDLVSDQNRKLLFNIFAAKQVPLALLAQMPHQREFHRPDWPAVVSTAGVPLQDFDFYFDFVLAEVERLKSFWIEEPPA